MAKAVQSWVKPTEDRGGADTQRQRPRPAPLLRHRTQSPPPHRRPRTGTHRHPRGPHRRSSPSGNRRGVTKNPVPQGFIVPIFVHQWDEHAFYWAALVWRSGDKVGNFGKSFFLGAGVRSSLRLLHGRDDRAPLSPRGSANRESGSSSRMPHFSAAKRRICQCGGGGYTGVSRWEQGGAPFSWQTGVISPQQWMPESSIAVRQSMKNM